MDTSLMLLVASFMFWLGFLAIPDGKNLFEFKWTFFIIALACLAYSFAVNNILSGNSYYTALNGTTITTNIYSGDKVAQGVSAAFGIVLIGYVALWLYKAYRGLLGIEGGEK